MRLSLLSPRVQMSSKWLRCRFKKPDAKLRLVCFPWAGGGTSYYTGNWAQKLSTSNIEVHAVCLPGRENRFVEAFYQDWQALVAEFCQDNHEELKQKPFAFWGHSFGGPFCVEVARVLKAQYGVEPCHLFVSGAFSLQIPRPHRGYKDMPYEVLAARIRGWGGTPSAILDNKEIMKLSVKILRADLTLLDLYKFSPDPVPGPVLSCPITCFDGDNDIHEQEGYRELTSGDFTRHVLPGGHFYFFNNDQPLLDLITNHLQPRL